MEPCINFSVNYDYCTRRGLKMQASEITVSIWIEQAIHKNKQVGCAMSLSEQDKNTA